MVSTSFRAGGTAEVRAVKAHKVLSSDWCCDMGNTAYTAFVEAHTTPAIFLTVFLTEKIHLLNHLKTLPRNMGNSSGKSAALAGCERIVSRQGHWISLPGEPLPTTSSLHFDDRSMGHRDDRTTCSSVSNTIVKSDEKRNGPRKEKSNSGELSESIA